MLGGSPRGAHPTCFVANSIAAEAEARQYNCRPNRRFNSRQSFTVRPQQPVEKLPFAVGGWGIAKRCPRGWFSWGTASLCPSHPCYFFNGPGKGLDDKAVLLPRISSRRRRYIRACSTSSTAITDIANK